MRHGDRASRHRSIRHTGRLSDAGAASSAGSRGDGYDGALAETTTGPCKAGPTRDRGPRRDLGQAEYATWSGQTGSITAAY